MIQIEIACPNCGSPDQKKLSSTKFECGNCRSVWFTEGSENPQQPDEPDFQDGPVMVVKPVSIQVGQFLLSKGYLVGQLEPTTYLGNWWYLDVFEKRDPVATKGFLGSIRMITQPPARIARFVFNDERVGATPDEWVLEYYGEPRTEEFAALARELAAEFDVKIYVVLETA